LSLALEAGKCPSVMSNFIGQKFDGDEAMQADIFSFLNHTHAAATQSFKNAVVREGLP
jgi:hypothetical protein